MVIFNSYAKLPEGKHGYLVSTTVARHGSKESNFEALKFECTNTLNNLSSIATKEHDNVFQHDHRLKHQNWARLPSGKLT